MAGWCWSCETEWWADADRCPDCGDDLRDDAPPEPEPPDGIDENLEPVRLDLGPLTDDDRWRIRLELDNARLPHEWDDHVLVTFPPVEARLRDDGLLDEIAPTPEPTDTETGTGTGTEIGLGGPPGENPFLPSGVGAGEWSAFSPSGGYAVRGAVAARIGAWLRERPLLRLLLILTPFVWIALVILKSAGLY